MQAISRSFLFWKERNRGALAVGKRQHRRIVTLERRKIASLNTRNVRSSAIRTTSIDEVYVVTLWSLSDSSHGHSVQARIRHLNPQLALQSGQRCCEDRGGSQEELKELSDITFIDTKLNPFVSIRCNHQRNHDFTINGEIQLLQMLRPTANLLNSQRKASREFIIARSS